MSNEPYFIRSRSGFQGQELAGINCPKRNHLPVRTTQTLLRKEPGQSLPGSKDTTITCFYPCLYCGEPVSMSSAAIKDYQTFSLYRQDSYSCIDNLRLTVEL